MLERVLFGYKRLGVCYPWCWFIYVCTHRDWSPEGIWASCCWMEPLHNARTQKCFACLKRRPVKCLSRWCACAPSQLKHWAALSSELLCGLSLWRWGCVTCHPVGMRHRPGKQWHITLDSCYSNMTQKLRSSGFKLQSDSQCWVMWPFLGARPESCRQ